MRQTKVRITMSVIVFFIVATMTGSAAAKECVFRMGYKPHAKEPYIFNDNSGIYHDVYGEALKRIGCRLEIFRLPKRRIIQKLKLGTIDFYPTFGYTDERAAFTYFIFNWLPHRGAVVTRDDIPPLDSLKDLMRYKPTLLKEIGGYSPMEAIPGKRFETTDIDIEKSFKLLLNKRIDAFYIQEIVAKYYLNNHPEIQGVRIHQNLFPPVQTKTLGFSRRSPYFREKINPDYDRRLPTSQHNPVTIIDENSTAYRFAKSLEELYKSGQIQKITDRYLHQSN